MIMTHKNKKFIRVNWDSKSSVFRAEQKKMLYENMGLRLVAERNVGVNSSEMVYE
jgi:hypothetical protein